VIKSHGRARAKAITNAVKVAAGFIRGRLNDHIVEELRKLSWSAWFTKWFSWSKEGE
jgi:fatty acid/phospholipid biosynthesis enzyme